ncbi:FAD-dependent monooxygenase [Streptomyces chartreusis]|uniref:FAD-dependent monooxygenase n=1 Tax=Streptomyces chartreusis TaxID=1969 RepID=UPI00123D52B4|nr:FAD-binding protein [Streptomyces chartreusis]
MKAAVSDALILGSGPAGLMTAILLAAEGRQVTLVDRDPPPPRARETTCMRVGSASACVSFHRRTSYCQEDSAYWPRSLPSRWTACSIWAPSATTSSQEHGMSGR